MSEDVEYRLDDLSGKEFEDLVAGVLSSMGLEIEERSTGADGGVDLVVRSFESVKGGMLVVQCKRQASKVGAPVVRDLLGVVAARRANKGILITNASFTPSAIEFAQDNRVELIDGEDFRRLLRGFGGGADLLPGTHLAAEARQHARVVVGEATRIAELITEQDRKVVNDLVPLPKKYFKSIEEAGAFFSKGVLEKLAAAGRILQNQFEHYFSHGDSLASAEEMRRRFADLELVVKEYFSIQRSLHCARPIEDSEVPALYPNEGGRRLKGLTLLAEHHRGVIEGYRNVLHLWLMELARVLQELADSSLATLSRGNQEGRLTSDAHRGRSVSFNPSEAVEEMERLSGWSQERMEEVHRFL